MCDLKHELSSGTYDKQNNCHLLHIIYKDLHRVNGKCEYSHADLQSIII